MASHTTTGTISSWQLRYPATGTASWSIQYSGSYSITVNRAAGSSTADVTISTTMTTNGDSNTNGWFANLTIGSTSYRFQIGKDGGHNWTSPNTAVYPPGTVDVGGILRTPVTQTHTETKSVTVGDSAGTLSGSINFEIAPYGGNTAYAGGYSSSSSWSVEYDSRGESTVSSLSKTSVNFAENFNVVVSRNVSGYRESIILKYGSNYSESYILSSYSDSSASSTTRSVSIPISLGSGRGTQFNYKIAVKTYNGSTQVGSEKVYETVCTVSFSSAQRSTATMTTPYFGNTSTITISRPATYFRETVQFVWSDNTTVTLRNYNSSGSDSTTVTYTIPYNTCPPSAVTRVCWIKVTSYNGSTQIGVTESSNYTVTIKSGDTHYVPAIGNVTNTVTNTISGLGTQAVIGTSKVSAQLPIGNVTTRENASVTATEIKFSDGKTKTGGNATISETSNTIDRASYVTTFKVTDSRGLTATKTATVSAINVTSPSFSSLDVYRANSSGQRDDTGTYIYARAVPSYQQTIGSVTNVCTIQMSVNGGSAVTVPASTLTRIYDSADTTQAYTVSAVVSDLIHSATTVRTVGAESVSFNIKNDGDGIGIGKYAVHSNAIDLAYDIYTDANVIHKNYQNTVAAGGTASIDNSGKGLTTYYVVYCGLNSSDQPVSGTDSAGVIIMYEGQQIMKEGFTGLTTSISGTTFNFGFSSGNNKLKYRVFENSLGSFT